MRLGSLIVGAVDVAMAFASLVNSLTSIWQWPGALLGDSGDDRTCTPHLWAFWTSHVAIWLVPVLYALYVST
jgi:hypothetical protein